MDWRKEAARRKKKLDSKPSANGAATKPRPVKTNRKAKWQEARQLAGKPAAVPVTKQITHEDPFPDDPPKQAYFGILGDLVRAIEPHTEASSVAILVQALAAFGNVVGRGPHFFCDGARHYTNVFATIVGKTGKSRKGTSWARVLDLFCHVDPKWARGHIGVGLSSGEGLVYHANDPEGTLLGIRQTEAISGQPVAAVPLEGSDKRLLIVESEFASVLKVADRQGNNLSAVIRQAWDGQDLRSMSKNNVGICLAPHISIIGHVTQEELRRYLSTTEAANGFANRFLWVAIRRNKYLPEGGGRHDFSPFVDRFREVVSFARAVGEMPRDDEARELWIAEYPRLSADRPGMLGALTARSEAYCMRLACLYALLDCSCQVEVNHLQAALALWNYCERSTAYLFGHSTGDTVADEILAALKTAKEGLSRNDIYLLFSKNQSRDRLARALLVLQQGELAYATEVKTEGRPKEVWKFGRTS